MINANKHPHTPEFVSCPAMEMRETVLNAGDLQRVCIERQLSLGRFANLKNISLSMGMTLMLLQRPGNQLSLAKSWTSENKSLYTNTAFYTSSVM